MSAWALLALPGRRGIRRRREHGVLSAQPHELVGAQRRGGRLATDPDLRRTAGAVQFLRLRVDHTGSCQRPGRSGRRRRDGQRARRRDREWQPDLLRHGGVLAQRHRHESRAHVPVGLDRDAALRRLRVRRLQQRRLGDRRPRCRVQQPELPEARRHLDRRLERVAHDRRSIRARRRLARAPADPPVLRGRRT